MFDSKESLEKSFSMMDNSMERMWDLWLVSLGSLSWTQEQIESMVRKYLDQSKSSREENLNLVKELSKQAQRNQQQFQKMVEDAVVSAFDNINTNNFNLFKDLSEKIDELSKKVQQSN